MSLLEELPEDLIEEEEYKFTGKIIDIHTDNGDLEGNWYFLPIYKENQSNGTMIWQIGYIHKDQRLMIKHGTISTSKGKVGKLSYDYIKVEINESGRSYQQQAYIQAKKRYIDKIRENYSTGDKSTNGMMIPVQLAKPYMGKFGKKSITEKHLMRGVSCQPKIDGIRARIWRTPDGIKIYSRKGLEFNWLDHIKSKLEDLLLLLPDQCGLDGELYSDKLTFEALTSAIKTRVRMHENNKLISYHIFDIVLPKVILEDRIKFLYDTYCTWKKDNQDDIYIKLVKSYKVHTYEEIEQTHDYFVSIGYEGLIMRKFLGIIEGNPTEKELEETWYKGNKNNNLIKYKKFIDEEGEVIAINSGKDREEGLAIFTILSKSGKTFECRPSETFEQRAYYYQHQSEFIGKEYTYKYFELTDAGIPRFPVGIGFRDYE